MARELHADVVTALETRTIRPALFVKMEFDSDDLNVWSGIGTFTLGSDDYAGLGNLGGISAVNEGTTLDADAVDFKLSGVPSAYIALALAEPYKYKPIALRMALLDEDSAVIGDEFILFKGKMDTMTIKEGAEISEITLRAESVLKSLDYGGTRKFSFQSHAIDYPSDKFFNMLNTIQNQELIFGPTPGREPARRSPIRPIIRRGIK